MLAIERRILLTCIREITRALVRFCIRHSLKVQDVETCLRRAFIEGAKNELRQQGDEPSLSRVSIITGLGRREVQRLEQLPAHTDTTPTLIMKVLGQWQTDRKFIDKAGAPRVLSFGSEKSDFNRLVNHISTDLNPATLLFELERVKAVERSDEGLRLVVQSYRPRGDVETGFRVLGDDINDLTRVVEENVFHQPDIGNLHLRTEYDRIRPEALVELKSWLLVEGNALHARVREKLSKYDQDVNPDPNFKGKGMRVVVGSFGKVFSENEEVV